MINIFSLLLSLLNNAYFISYIKSKTFDLPLTFKEEQFYLQKKCNGDKAARDLLIEKNLRLVAHIAKKYNNNRDLQEDLISIGTIGLIKAIDSYSIDKKTKLATYASKCIENEILMHLRSAKKINQEVSLNEVIGVDKDGSEVVFEDLIEKQTNPTVAPYAKLGEVHLRVTAKAVSEDEAKKLVTPITEELYRRFGHKIFTTKEDETLEDVWLIC